MNEPDCPAATATARTSNISSVAYAVEDNASDENTARATFFVSRSSIACSVLSALPTSTRLIRAKKLIRDGGRKSGPAPKETTRAIGDSRLIGRCAFMRFLAGAAALAQSLNLSAK